MKNRTLSLQRTVLLAACIGLLIPALIIHSYSWIDIYSGNIEKETATIAEQNAATLAISVAKALATTDQREMKTTVEDAMQRNGNIVLIEIKSKKNEILVSGKSSNLRQGPIVAASNTIYFLGQEVGFIKVEASGGALKQLAFRHIQYQLLALAAQILLTVFLLVIVLDKRLAQPLLAIQTHIRKWGKGTFNEPITSTHNDEIGLFKQCMEDVQLALQASFTDLIQKNERLTQVQKLSENRFFHAFHHNPDAMSITSLVDGLLIEANSAFENITGHMNGTWRGKSTLQLGLWSHPENREVFFEELAHNGHVSDFPCHLRHREGVSKHCLVNATTFTIKHEKYLLVVLRDITKQRLLEKQKAEADHALLRLAQGTQNHLNGSFFSSLVNDLASALCTSCAFIFLRDVSDIRYLHALAACVEGELIEPFKYSISDSPCQRTLKGAMTFFADDVCTLFPHDAVLKKHGCESYAGAPLHDANGHVIGVLVVMHNKPLRNPDLVRSLLQVFSERASAELERKRAEEELRLSEQRFATIFHSTPLPMFVTQLSDDNIIKDINSAFEKLFLHKRENVIGKSTLDLAIYSNPKDRETLLEEMRSTGKIENHEEVWMLRRDREKILIHFSCNLFTFDGEEFCIFSCQDVTEKRLIEQEIRELNSTLEERVIERTEELHQANQELETTLDALNLAQAELVNSEKLAALGALVAGISHELNTPIGNSLMVASALHDQTSSLIRAYQDNQGIKRSSLESYLADTGKAGDILTRNLQRAADLVNSFKQVAIDQVSSQRREFSLAEVSNEILLTLWPVIRKSPFTVEQTISEDIRLDSYPGPLGQVLNNLINNALLHGFEGRKTGKVEIVARIIEKDAEQHLVELTVSDNGIGMPAERLRKIFDPFFTTKLGAGGSGLGLNITHNIVTGVLGGRIRVQSAIDVGTSFILLLPLVAPVRKDSDDALHQQL